MRIFLTVFGSLIVAAGFLPYLIATSKGTVRPRIASWATWSLVTGIATVAAFSEGAFTSAFLTGIITIVELAILFTAIKKGDYDYSWVDAASQVVSLIGIVAWLTTNNPMWAIIFNMIADFFGAVPTFYHSWISPHDEAWLPFVLSGVGAGVSLMAVESIGFVTAGFPVYLTLMGFVLGLSIYFRQKLIPVRVSE